MSQSPFPSDPGTSSEARTWGMCAHLAAFSGYIVPFGHIIGPLIVWLVKREEFPFVDHHGKESLNFQISCVILALICIPLCFVCIGFFLLPVVAIFNIVFTIIAAIKANEGVLYKYPYTLRLI